MDDKTRELVDKVGNMQEMRYEVMTVSSLITRLAGLPPMMEVYADADGTSMYVNEVQMQEAKGFPPFLRVICNTYPKPPAMSDKSYDEQLAEMRQRAMQMGHNSQEAQRMPDGVFE